MANEEHLAILRQGVEVWNEWREKNADVIPGLSYAELSQANLNDTDLGQAHMGYTWIGNVDLSTVKGLETVIHHGLSTISVGTLYETLYASQGQIPEAFLRGAGVPDSLITYLHSLTGEALQYKTCLISYTTPDREFAQRLHADLMHN